MPAEPGATPSSSPLAVAAIGHPPGHADHPRLIAKGAGPVAEQILELAFAHGVKVREDGDLLAILSALELDSEIPLPALAAVAEILNHVYRANAASEAPPPRAGSLQVASPET